MKVILNEYRITSRVLFALPDKSETIAEDVNDIHSNLRLKKKQVCASAFFEDGLMRVDERIKAVKVREAAFLHLLRCHFGDTFKSDGVVAHGASRRKVLFAWWHKTMHASKERRGVCVDKYQFM